MTPTIPKQLPGPPETVHKGDLGTLYILFYRTGMAPRPQEIFFQHPGTIHDAVAFAKDYCIKLGYRFVIVQKFLHDLSEDIKRYNSEGSGG